MSHFLVNPYAFKTLLLDAYGGAAGAYSLRKLRDGYAGSAIRVRRSNDNAEQDIGFDAGGNLDESSLTAFVGANSGFVTTWYDQSGNGRNATQTTSGNQPRIVNSGTVEKVNGKVAVRFTGSPMRLANSTQGFSVNNTSFYTISTRSSSVAAFRTIFSTGILTATGVGFGSFYRDTGNDELRAQFRNQNITNISIGDFANTVNVPVLTFAIGTSSEDFAWFNGGNGVSQVHSRANVTTNREIALGSNSETPPTQYHIGTIQEVVFWQANQSTNRSAIETDINGYYSIY
jgi:hypothetical protein